MKKLIVVGCSVSSGVGFDPNNLIANCYDHPDLWVNLCHQNIEQLKELQLINRAKGGASNRDVFVEAVDAMSSIPDIKYLWCQWTSIHRMQIDIGFELYPTRIRSNTVIEQDINTNQFRASKKFLKQTMDSLTSLIHPHHEILEVVRYVNVVNRLANALGITVFHANARLPWDNNYFDKLENVFPEQYTEYTKKHILFVDNRNDQETQKLYNQLHQDYSNAGGINAQHWFNLYNPFYTPQNKIDTNYDNTHAGTKSNQNFYSIVKKFFSNI